MTLGVKTFPAARALVPKPLLQLISTFSLEHFSPRFHFFFTTTYAISRTPFLSRKQKNPLHPSPSPLPPTFGDLRRPTSLTYFLLIEVPSSGVEKSVPNYHYLRGLSFTYFRICSASCCWRCAASTSSLVHHILRMRFVCSCVFPD